VDRGVFVGFNDDSIGWLGSVDFLVVRYGSFLSRGLYKLRENNIGIPSWLA
jgi:hypothetical protein